MNVELASSDSAAGSGASALKAFHPNIVTARFYETWDFYTSHLGFRTISECDTYVHLVHPAGAQLGVMKHERDGQLPELVSATNGCGWWLSLDVTNADLEHARLVAEGVTIAMPPEDKPWGERSFAVRDPNGVLILVAHSIKLTSVFESTSGLLAASLTR